MPGDCGKTYIKNIAFGPLTANRSIPFVDILTLIPNPKHSDMFLYRYKSEWFCFFMAKTGAQVIEANKLCFLSCVNTSCFLLVKISHVKHNQELTFLRLVHPLRKKRKTHILRFKLEATFV